MFYMLKLDLHWTINLISFDDICPVMPVLVAVHTSATWLSDLVSVIVSVAVDLPDALLTPWRYMVTSGAGWPPSAVQVKVTWLFSCCVRSDGDDVSDKLLGASTLKFNRIDENRPHNGRNVYYIVINVSG